MIPNPKFTAAALITSALLLVGVTLKQRELNRGRLKAIPVLAAGSLHIAPMPSPQVVVPRPDARVAAGPPRMFHLDPAHTNRSPFLAPRQPKLAWAFDAQSPIETAPALLDDGTIVVATLSGKLFGVHPDGSQAFVRDLGDRVYASPLVANGLLFIGSDQDRFYAFSSKAEQRFVFGTDGDADTAPNITPWGAVTFAAGSTLYAMRKDGTVAWRVKGKRKFYSAPAVAQDGTVFVSSQDDHLYAIDKTGKTRFSTGLGQDADCAPSIGDDGAVFAATDGGAIVRLDPTSGQIRWKTSTDGHVRGGLTLTRNDAVVAGTYGPAPKLVALDASTGKTRFEFAIQGTGAREFGIHGSPVEDAAGNLCFGAQDDAIRCLDSGGNLIFSFMTGGDVDAPVVLPANGVLLAASDDGKLYRLDEGTLSP